MELTERELRMKDLLALFDRIGPLQPRGLALRPGFALYRPNGESLGLTKPGDRLLHLTWQAGGPDGWQSHMPSSSIPEWVQGQLNDAEGPAFTVVLVLAAAVDPDTE